MAARGRDPNFDGSYETSRYADRSIEEMLLDAMDGKVITPTDSGMRKVTYDSDGRETRAEEWIKGEPGNYPHFGINENGDFFKK